MAWKRFGNTWQKVTLQSVKCCLCIFMVPQFVHTLAGESFQIRELRDLSHSCNLNSMTVLRNCWLLCSSHESASHINSFCSHNDTFVASSKVNSQQNAIYCFLFQFPVFSLFLRGARSGAVGWGTVLQARRLRVPFQLVSQNFSLT